jgi:FtsZ-binding cell division protein ZapB
MLGYTAISAQKVLERNKEKTNMKSVIAIICVILLVAAFGLLGLAENQKGGLPALEDRVERLEHKVASLISQVESLQLAVRELRSAVSALQSAVNSLQVGMAKLTRAVKDLRGQNNWAVITSSGNVVRHSGSSDVIGTKLGTGTYNVLFTETNVSDCAYTATIGDVGKASPIPGLITVSGGSSNDVQVQTFDMSGKAADSAFHLYVSCP